MVDRRLRFVRLHVAWMVSAVAVLVALEAFSLVLFSAVSVIGFYLVYEATATGSVRPRWRRRAAVGGGVLVLGFAAVAAYQIWEIVSAP